MRIFLTVTAAAALVTAVALAAGAAVAGDGGVYESPFVADTDGGEVAGSEGKVRGDASYKVEIDTGIANTSYAVCMVLDHSESWIAVATTDEDGELKSEGRADALTAVRDHGKYGEFIFRIRDASGNTCNGKLRWKSKS